jgi:hypothetical protein
MQGPAMLHLMKSPFSEHLMLNGRLSVANVTDDDALLRNLSVWGRHEEEKAQFFTHLQLKVAKT